MILLATTSYLWLSLVYNNSSHLLFFELQSLVYDHLYFGVNWVNYWVPNLLVGLWMEDTNYGNCLWESN
jgi:hypothetical protein